MTQIGVRIARAPSSGGKQCTGASMSRMVELLEPRRFLSSDFAVLGGGAMIDGEASELHAPANSRHWFGFIGKDPTLPPGATEVDASDSTGGTLSGHAAGVRSDGGYWSCSMVASASVSASASLTLEPTNKSAGGLAASIRVSISAAASMSLTPDNPLPAGVVLVPDPDGFTNSASVFPRPPRPESRYAAKANCK